VTTTLVVMGVSGSGKTTVAVAVAEQLGWLFAEGDDFHPAANVAKMAAGHPLTDEDRRPWLAVLAEWIGAREAAGTDAVLTCSALRRVYRDTLAAGHPSVRFVHITASPETILTRLEQRRGHYMPATLLDSQLATLEPLQPGEAGFRVSIDGTEGEIVAGIVEQLRGQGTGG
jgi:gluconokinase